MRQYCLWIKVGLGLCSHGHRNPPGSCQEPCSSPNLQHAVGWMLTTQRTPRTGEAPGHNLAWPCNSQQQHEGFYPSWPVPFPEQCRHPAAPHQHEQHQQVKGEWGRLKTRVSSKARGEAVHAHLHTLGLLEHPFHCALSLGRMFTGPEGLCCNKIHKNSYLFYTSHFSCTALTA